MYLFLPGVTMKHCVLFSPAGRYYEALRIIQPRRALLWSITYYLAPLGVTMKHYVLFSPAGRYYEALRIIQSRRALL